MEDFEKGYIRVLAAAACGGGIEAADWDVVLELERGGYLSVPRISVAPHIRRYPLMTPAGRNYLAHLNALAAEGEPLYPPARTWAAHPNLAAWLAAYPFTGKVTRLSQRRHLRAVSEVRKEAGITRWPHDCMRHSFATYAYEQSKDAAAVAAELGHQGTDVFFRHYRALATPGDGKAFFSIYPKNWERIGNGTEKRQQKRICIKVS